MTESRLVAHYDDDHNPPLRVLIVHDQQVEEAEMHIESYREKVARYAETHPNGHATDKDIADFREVRRFLLI